MGRSVEDGHGHKDGDLPSCNSPPNAPGAKPTKDAMIEMSLMVRCLDNPKGVVDSFKPLPELSLKLESAVRVDYEERGEFTARNLSALFV